MTDNSEDGPTHVRHLEDELLAASMDALDGFTEPAGGEISLRGEFSAQCPFDDITDDYEVTVTYTPSSPKPGDDPLHIELKSFREFLNMFAGVEAPQEAIAEFMLRLLSAHYAPESLRVELVGDHYDIEETVVRERP